MFERFTGPAREALVDAQRQAILAGATEIGPEHLLAAVLRVEDGRVREVLEALGIDPAEAERTVAAHLDATPPPPPATARRKRRQPQVKQVPFATESKAALEATLRETARLGHDSIGSAHLLLGLLRAESGTTQAVLGRLGIELDPARTAVAAAVSGRPARPTGRPFRQVDVFGSAALSGNPVAVVHDAEGLTDEQMAAFARWTNLSETTFLLTPTHPAADYRLRIFTPGGELAFAGHPTLGSAHAWLEAGGVPKGGQLVQECGIGLVRLRRTERLAFAAPPLIRSGPVEAIDLDRIVRALRIDRAAVLDSRWVDNGAGWVAVRLRDADAVLALTPDFSAFGEGLDIGVVGPRPEGGEAQVEVRGFAPHAGIPEDPVTGSLNAGLAQWLIGDGTLPRSYVAAQGTAIGRAGRIHVDSDPADADVIWIGGDTRTTITGAVSL